MIKSIMNSTDILNEKLHIVDFRRDSSIPVDHQAESVQGDS